ESHESVVARLAQLARRRPLTQQEQEKLMRELAMMRMVCDTNYILDPEDKVCPKLAELEKLLEECRENDAKVIIFSEWERMLDLKGNLHEIKLRTGRQAFLAKLEQLVPAKPAAAGTPQLSTLNPQPVLPADRPLGFARKARERINGALLQCEERYPNQGPHSVLYVVVDRDAAQWRERLNDLHRDFFGPAKNDPLAPVQLEVVDRATHEALEQLAA